MSFPQNAFTVTMRIVLIRTKTDLHGMAAVAVDCEMAALITVKDGGRNED